MNKVESVWLLCFLVGTLASIQCEHQTPGQNETSQGDEFYRLRPGQGLVGSFQIVSGQVTDVDIPRINDQVNDGNESVSVTESSIDAGTTSATNANVLSTPLELDGSAEFVVDSIPPVSTSPPLSETRTSTSFNKSELNSESEKVVLSTTPVDDLVQRGALQQLAESFDDVPMTLTSNDVDDAFVTSESQTVQTQSSPVPVPQAYSSVQSAGQFDSKRIISPPSVFSNANLVGQVSASPRSRPPLIAAIHNVGRTISYRTGDNQGGYRETSVYNQPDTPAMVHIQPSRTPNMINLQFITSQQSSNQPINYKYVKEMPTRVVTNIRRPIVHQVNQVIEPVQYVRERVHATESYPVETRSMYSLPPNQSPMQPYGNTMNRYTTRVRLSPMMEPIALPTVHMNPNPSVERAPVAATSKPSFVTPTILTIPNRPYSSPVQQPLVQRNQIWTYPQNVNQNVHSVHSYPAAAGTQILYQIDRNGLNRLVSQGNNNHNLITLIPVRLQSAQPQSASLYQYVFDGRGLSNVPIQMIPLNLNSIQQIHLVPQTTINAQADEENKKIILNRIESLENGNSIDKTETSTQTNGKLDNDEELKNKQKDVEALEEQ